MAKRFTDTEKWKKPFIRGLQGAYKLLWLYICDDCDHAGIWQVDMQVAEIRIGEKITLHGAIESFGDKIVIFDNGNKWFIPSFLEFQYPSGLNPDNRAHNSIINLLEKYSLLKNENKPLISPLQGSKDMDKDMDMVKDKDKDMVKEEKKFKKNEIPTLTEFLDFCKSFIDLELKLNYSDYEFVLKAKYERWVEDGWKDGNGNSIKGWKSKIKNTFPHLTPVKMPVKQAVYSKQNEELEEYKKRQRELGNFIV